MSRVYIDGMHLTRGNICVHELNELEHQLVLEHFKTKEKSYKIWLPYHPGISIEQQFL